MNNQIIKQITKSGIILSITLLFGIFLHFPLGGANISLVITPIAVLPLFLNYGYSLLVTAIGVALVDILSGWAAFSWISAITYTLFMFIYFPFAKLKKINILMLVIAMLHLLTLYFLIDLLVFGFNFAIDDIIATSIQLSISLACTLPINFLLQSRLVKEKILKNNLFYNINTLF